MLVAGNLDGPRSPASDASMRASVPQSVPEMLSGTTLTLTAAWGLGEDLRRRAAHLAQSEQKARPSDLLYCEKAGGFSCRTCRYAVPQNATHGRCVIMDGTIHLDEGCCALWDADPAQLHLYREPAMP